MFRILKSDSLAKSVVGLIGKFLGALMRLPLYFPDIILTIEAVQNGLSSHIYQESYAPEQQIYQKEKRF